MQLLKKINLRTTGILIYAIYTLLVCFVTSIFQIMNLLDYLKNSYKFPFENSLNYYSLLTSFLSPILFVIFLIALYNYNSKQKGEKALKIIGVLFLILQCIFILVRLINIHLSFSLNGIIALFIYLLMLSLKIGFVLFVLTKYKKVMLSVLSIGLFFSMFDAFYKIFLYINIYLSGKYINYPIDFVHSIVNIPLLLIGLLVGVLIWFYCFYETRNKQKVINEEIITQSIETDQEQ